MIKFEYKLLFFFLIIQNLFCFFFLIFFQYLIIKILSKMAVNDERYVFIVEWFDTSASLIRSYNFTYFMADKTIEMVLI